MNRIRITCEKSGNVVVGTPLQWYLPGDVAGRTARVILLDDAGRVQTYNLYETDRVEPVSAETVATTAKPVVVVPDDRHRPVHKALGQLPPEWSDQWRRQGFNGCLSVAMAALRHFREGGRVAEGVEQDYNALHLGDLILELQRTIDGLAEVRLNIMEPE